MHDDQACEEQMRAIIDAAQPLLAATDPKRVDPATGLRVPANAKEVADAREGLLAVLSRIVVVTAKVPR